MHTLYLRSMSGDNPALDGQATQHQQGAKKTETIKKCEAKEKPKIMRNFATRAKPRPTNGPKHHSLGLYQTH